MQDREKPGRPEDPVAEASGESFPASDPPAWTAARVGKPEPEADRDARRRADSGLPGHGEVLALFPSAGEARPAADELLSSGFNFVEIGPPQLRGNHGAGLHAHASPAAPSLALCAALGAAAAAILAALLIPRHMRNVLTAAAGGAIGAVSARSAAQALQERNSGRQCPPGAVLLRVRAETPDERKRAIAILDAYGARELYACRPAGR